MINEKILDNGLKMIHYIDEKDKSNDKIELWMFLIS